MLRLNSKLMMFIFVLFWWAKILDLKFLIKIDIKNQYFNINKSLYDIQTIYPGSLIKLIINW
jgi:hypothetical protein